ncbi:MAG: hypothetical protein PHN59_04235 [Candidatus Omnitrophica bacterium]|nr:hypothetical protein [Candidatus Omnitrophota bacterium]
MQFRGLTPKILLLVGFLALILVYSHQAYLKRTRDFNLKKLQTYSDNFFAEGDPEVIRRVRPVSSAYKEGELIATFGRPFSDFNDEAWASFWDIIYKIFPIVEPEEPGLPNKMRQLSEGEIVNELINRYQQPFSNFTKDGWNMFFDIIINK